MRIFPVLLLACCVTTVAAQKTTTAASKTYRHANGAYTVSFYADSMVKITYQPKGYTTGEQVSDAVIGKPLSRPTSLPVRVSKDSVFIGRSVVLTGVVDTAGYKGLTFRLQEGERIFGGGERALPLDRRGYRLNLVNNPWYGYGEGADNLNYSVPFFTSSKGYALFFDNPSRGYFDIGKKTPGAMEWGASSGELSVYVILGNYQQVLHSYHRLTGTQPLPPLWALGNFMSRFGYTSEKQVQGILGRMKSEAMPVDAIIFDLFWFGDSVKGTMGNLDWVNKEKWPDPKGMISGFRRQGINTILVTEPYIVETAHTYKAGKNYFAVDSTGKPYYLTQFYFGKGGLLDIFRKDAQTWWWPFYRRQMQNGVEAWWGDLGEPEHHPADLYHNLKDFGHKRLFSASEVRNVYGHNWTKMLYQNFAKEYPAKRLFSLNRSGFAGTQRYGIFPWTGDVSRSWSGYRAQLPVLLGMSMSGVPYVHSDAGGFAGGEGDEELYVRWLQYAAFTPIFRPHGTGLFEIEPTAKSFPSEPALIDTPYRAIAREAVQLRYAFLPYNYTLAYGQARYGKPLMAPLYYYYPSDTTAARIQDQYFWGEQVMVAPVLEKGVTIRRYYLPEGDWYYARKQQRLNGGRWYTDTVSLKEFPVLYKEGSFIVLNPQADKNTSHYNGERLSVNYVVSDKPSAYELYNDDGTSKESLSKGAYELIRFRAEGRKGGQATISITPSGGTYTGRPARRELLFSLLGVDTKPSAVYVNGKPVSEEDYVVELGRGGDRKDPGLVTFGLSFTGKPVEIKIVW
jgi:oligosaccharide 4-alpha-D-glucosyltransferase